jgi:uncharacterized protein (TIGR03067 family)
MSRQLICSVVALVLGTAFLNLPLCMADDKKADDQKDAAKEELQQLEGTWVAVSSEMGARKMLIKDLPAKEAPRITIVFKNGKGTYVVQTPRGQGKANEMPVVVDSTQTPKTLDVQATMKMPTGPKTFSLIKGIYQVEADTLTICYTNPTAAGGMAIMDLPRPKEIKADAKTVLLTFQRQKP